MNTSVIDKNTERESLDSWLIESQLAEIGVPYLPLSWQDEFLMAENLQNYFAEVIAGYSHLEMEEEDKQYPDTEKLDLWENLSRKVILERKKYHTYNLASRQRLLIKLMKEAKQIENLRANGFN
jgi:hypothetical protein